MQNLIYGHHPVTEAIKAGKPVEKVYFQMGLRGELEKEIRHLTRQHGVPLQVVPREKLNGMVRGVHQGVVAILSLAVYQSLEDIVPFVFESGKMPFLLLLDHVTDVRNFGAICRSAYCGGVDAVIVPQSGAAAINEEAMKASAGALAKTNICRVKSLVSTTSWLQESGIQVLATAVQQDSTPIYKANFNIPTAIILGAEGPGVHPKLLKMADSVVHIPQAQDFDSFNVSVAAGIIVYEAMRQRGF